MRANIYDGVITYYSRVARSWLKWEIQNPTFKFVGKILLRDGSLNELTDGIKNTWIGEVSVLFLGPSYVSTFYSPFPLKSRTIYSQHFKFCWIWDFQKAQSKVSKRNLLAGYYSKNNLSSSRGSGSSSCQKHYSVKVNMGLLRNSRTKDEPL